MDYYCMYRIYISLVGFCFVIYNKRVIKQVLKLHMKWEFKEDLPFILILNTFWKKMFKDIASQKRGGYRGVSIDLFRLPTPSLIFF
jgi:hypothetical protein